MDLLYQLLIAITDIGDSAVLGALVLAVSLFLLAQGCRRDALIFLGSFLVASLLVSITKILLMGCGTSLRQLGLHSPSGHSALSVSVLGSLALLLRNRITGKHHNLPLFILLPLAFAIAISRVVLGFHTKEEVMIGIIIGLLVLLGTNRLLSKQPAKRFNIYLLIYMSVAVAFMTHGLRLPAENIIQLFASHFRHLTHCG